MADRRLLTDIGLALLIAFPATLPAAPNPWSASDEVGKPSVADSQADSPFPYETAAIPIPNSTAEAANPAAATAHRRAWNRSTAKVVNRRRTSALFQPMQPKG